MRMGIATLLVFLLAMTACGGTGDETTAAQPSPGVSFLDYSPQPFFKDMDEMTVRFTTTGPASGDEYVVHVVTGKDKRDNDCYPEFGGEEGTGVAGEAGKTYVQVIQMSVEGTTDYDEGRTYNACTGPAEIVVTTTDFREVMRKLSFRILPPRSG